MDKRFVVLADENIPLLEPYFGSFAELRIMNGRQIRSRDLQGVDILLVRSVTRVDASLLAGTPVKFVASATIGKDHIDVEYLAEQGIGFANAPGCNANAVVQYVLTALFTLQGEALLGRKVAVVGCGNVGSSLYRKLRQLDIDCIAYDPYLEGRANLRFASFEQVLKADIICLHTPLEKHTRFPTYHMFDQPAISQLRPGTVLLNAGRGAVIDNQALLQRLEQSRDLQVVLDVWEGEPEIMPALLDLVDIATPHIAGYSYEGKIKGTQIIFQACRDYFNLSIDLPEPDKNQSAALDTKAWPELEQLPALLAEVYDIRADDANLRKSQNDVVSTMERGMAFDRLRKEYRQRREFEYYQLVGVENEVLAKHLRQLGFSVLAEPV